MLLDDGEIMIPESWIYASWLVKGFIFRYLLLVVPYFYLTLCRNKGNYSEIHNSGTALGLRAVFRFSSEFPNNGLLVCGIATI